jgi:hypothetical protein
MEGWFAYAFEELIAVQREMSVVTIFTVLEKGPLC